MFCVLKKSVKMNSTRIVFRNRVTTTKKVITLDRSILNIPYPKTLPLIGEKLKLICNGRGTKLHEYADKRHKQLGSIFCDTLGGSTKLVFISDPDHMKTLFLSIEGKYPKHILPEPWILYETLYGNKRGLFFMDGEEWLANRRIMNKYFLRENSEKWLEGPIQTTVTKFVLKLIHMSKDGYISPDLESEFYRLSIDIIIAILLGPNSALKTKLHYDDLLTMFSESVKQIFQTTTKLYGLPLLFLQKFNFKMWTNFKDSVETSLFLAQKLVTEMINERTKTDGLLNNLCEEDLSDETIKRIIVDFVIAAGDTTAFTTIWTLLLLSQNHEAQKELRDKGVTYAKNAIKESMRLYPVAPFLTRILTQQCNLGQYRLEEGTPIIASIWTSGRDEKYFTKADKFLPHRWDRNDLRKKELPCHVPSATLPFAFGARSCIGKKLAMVQLTEVVTQLVKSFDITCLNNSEVKPVMSQILVPNTKVKLLLNNKAL